jgi:indole-3-glycerol phosphate synthase
MKGYPFADPNCFDALSPLCHRHHVAKTILVDREYFKGNFQPLKEFKQMVELAKEMMQ